MRVLTAQNIPAPAASISGIIGILISLLQFLFRLIGLLPSSDDLAL
jgi:hypothetical protein